MEDARGEGRPQGTEQGEFGCACCHRTSPLWDSKICVSCRRRVCFGCLRSYGHHMLICEECFLASW